MPSYDWWDHRGETWPLRFPAGIPGSERWRENALNPASLVQTLAVQRLVAPVKLPRPCVFVSHRQADAQLALRIAYLVCGKGFDYWLDVLDPDLIGVAGLPPTTSPWATAAVIEMALLNSTHVIAVVTSNTKGSEWVPYEYGRVKAPTPASPQAACWIQDASIKIPEYMHLGPILYDEADINLWLDTFPRPAWYNAWSTLPCNWTKDRPAPL